MLQLLCLRGVIRRQFQRQGMNPLRQQTLQGIIHEAVLFHGTLAAKNRTAHTYAQVRRTARRACMPNMRGTLVMHLQKARLQLLRQALPHFLKQGFRHGSVHDGAPGLVEAEGCSVVVGAAAAGASFM